MVENSENNTGSLKDIISNGAVIIIEVELHKVLKGKRCIDPVLTASWHTTAIWRHKRRLGGYLSRWRRQYGRDCFSLNKEGKGCSGMTLFWFAQFGRAVPSLTRVVLTAVLFSFSIAQTASKVMLLLSLLNWSNQEIPCKETWCFLLKSKLQGRQQAFKFSAFRHAKSISVKTDCISFLAPVLIM